jgi:hypothetical protein
VVSLAEVDVEVRSLIDRILRGQQIGTPVSPLAHGLAASVSLDESQHGVFRGSIEVASEAPAEDWQVLEVELRKGPDELPLELQQGDGTERRSHPRREYQRRVELLELCDSKTDNSAQGYDLSLDGVRVVGYPELEAGAELTLALYAGRREEPLVVSAIVVRGCGPQEVAFRFAGLSECQRGRLEELTIGLAALESLDGHGDESCVAH